MTSHYALLRRRRFRKDVTLEQIDDFFTELPVLQTPVLARVIEHPHQTNSLPQMDFQQLANPKCLFQLICEVITDDVRILSLCKEFLPTALLRAVKELLPINKLLLAKSGSTKCLVCRDSGLYCHPVQCLRCKRLEKKAAIRSLLFTGNL